MDGQRNRKPQPLVFPSLSTTAASESKDKSRAKALAEKRDAEIREICEATSGALQELRHGVIYVLFDTLEMIDLGARALADRIDEPVRLVREIRQRKTDRLTTERLIEILEKLRPLLMP
jgi:hypothetical protein